MIAKYTIGHRVYTSSGEDDMGNETKSWANPVDLKVFFVAPTASLADSEPSEPSRTAVVTGLSVGVPRGAVLDAHDRYVLGDAWPPYMRGEWEQEGEVADYTHGPFSNRVGQLVLNLRRTKG